MRSRSSAGCPATSTAVRAPSRAREAGSCKEAEVDAPSLESSSPEKRSMTTHLMREAIRCNQMQSGVIRGHQRSSVRRDP